MHHSQWSGEHADFSLLSWRNDLTKTSIDLCPKIGFIIDELSDIKNCVYANMSGSGASVFGLFNKKDDADEACLALKNRGYFATSTFFLINKALKSEPVENFLNVKSGGNNGAV